MKFKNSPYFIPLSLAIIGVIMIVSGFCIDALKGYKGLTSISPNERSDKLRLLKNDVLVDDVELQLPFSIQLDDVTYEPFDTAFKIQLWHDNPAESDPGNKESNSTLIKSYDVRPGKIHRIYPTNMYFRLNEFFPNFGFTYDYPESIDTIAPEDPGIMMELFLPTGNAQLQLRTIVNNSLEEPHLNAKLEFYWKSPDDIALLREADQDIWNSGASPIKRIIFIGENEQVIYANNEIYTRLNLKRDESYLTPGKEPLGFKYQFTFPDAKYMKATPATLDQQIKNPVAKLEVWGTDWTRSELAYIYPSSRLKGGFYQVPSTSYSIGLGSNLNQSNRYISSDIRLINDEQMELTKTKLGKSESYSYQGYHLAHHNVQIKPSQALILSVNYLPGYYVVLAGMILTFAASALIIRQSFFSTSEKMNLNNKP